MARAHRRALALAALAALLATAAGTRYGGSDYVVHMPAYGDDDPPSPDRDDYRAHSPDAPASPDYNIKYEEVLKEKPEQSFGGEVNEANSWRRPIRKQRKRSDDEFRVDDLDKLEPDDDFPKTKSVNRFPKHRPRHKSRKFEDDIEERPRFLKRPVRDRSDDVPELGGDELQTDKDRFIDDIPSLESKKFRFAFRSSSVRPRRRPRDKIDRLKPSEDDEPYPVGDMGRDRSLDIWPLEKERDILSHRLSDSETLSRSRGGGGVASLRPVVPESGEDEEPPLVRPLKPSRNRYNNDNYDYYDMKRAMNIKNKLSSVRRTQERQRQLVPEPMPQLELQANRRVFQPTSRRTTVTTPRPTHTTITSTTTEETTKVFVTHTSIAPSTVSTTTVTANVSKELSIAEKSRLSILKKAQRKESGRSEVSTKKPPVLLQVTQQLHTLVMVEPPTSVGPWMRASLVAEDSPQRLKQVRRLMRQKLLSNARSIQDLTDNWDEVVCDYVDMSLIQNSAYTRMNTPQETKWTTPSSVAERELSAFLGAHRQRKDVSDAEGLADATAAAAAGAGGQPADTSTSDRSLVLPTFRPYALDPSLDAPWNEFVAANRASAAPARAWLWLLVIALVTYLDLYCIILRRIKDSCSYGNKLLMCLN